MGGRRYHLFGLLWTNQFVQGVLTVCVAGAVSQVRYFPSRHACLFTLVVQHYFTKDKSTLVRPTWRAFIRRARRSAPLAFLQRSVRTALA